MNQPSGTFRLVVMQYPVGHAHSEWVFAINEWDLALSEAKRMANEPHTAVKINLVYFDRPHEEKVIVWNSREGIL